MPQWFTRQPEPGDGMLFQAFLYGFCYNSQLKSINMGNLLYIIAVVLVVIWAIGFFGYAASGIIHVLLVIALVLFLLKVIRREA